MEKTTNSPQPETVSRRELLKALGAAGGALAAAAFLPGKWAKPLIEAGVMPAHAQASGVNIFSLFITPYRPGNHPNSPSQWNATFGYDDPLGEVDGSAKVWAVAQPCTNTVVPGTAVNSIGQLVPGSTGFAGSVSFHFSGMCINVADPSLNVYLAVGSRTSNTINGLYPTT